MDFFIILDTTIISPLFFVGGNMLFSYVMKKYLCLKKQPEPVIDEVQEYIK